MSGTKGSRGRDTDFFFVSGKRTAVRNFIRAVCSSSTVRSTGRRFGEGEGILRVLGQPVEGNTERAECAGHGSLHIPLLVAVGSEIEHPELKKSADRLQFGLFGREANKFQAILLREPDLRRWVRGQLLRVLHDATFPGRDGEHDQNVINERIPSSSSILPQAKVVPGHRTSTRA